MDPVWRALAPLMGGAPRPDGEGGWTLPTNYRYDHWSAPAFGDASAGSPGDGSARGLRDASLLEPRITPAQSQEGRQLAIAVARAVARALDELEPEAAQRLAGLKPAETKRQPRRGKPVGKHLKAISEDLIREAHELYWTGRDDAGRPLSVRKVAAIVLPRTGYKSAASCAECLNGAWIARGWPRRDRIAATRAATLVHGELVGTKDWRTPEARAKKNAYKAARRRRAKCKGVKQTYPQKGRPCPLWAMEGSDYCYQHDPSTKAARDAHLVEARARVGAGNHNEEDHRESRDHKQRQHVQRPPEALARAGGGAR